MCYIVLVNVDEHPDGAHIRKRKALRRAALQQLPWRHQPFDNFPGLRRE
jgi:hypothetical protein